MRGWLGWAIGLVVSLGCAIGSTFVARSFPPRELDVNMLFVPPPQMVKKGAAGFDNVLADSLWLTVLQYYGERYFSESRAMVNLDAMFGLITDLDPKFWFAYWLGAWALSDDHQPEAAIKLLQAGEAKNPDYLHYPYLQGFIYFLYLHDYVSAGQAFERAGTKPIAEWEDQKRFCRTMAARMYQRQGKDGLALKIWQNLYANAAEKSLKDIAKRNVERIQAEMRGERKKPQAFDPDKPEPGQVR